MNRPALSEFTKEKLLFLRAALILLALSIVIALSLYLGSDAFKQRNLNQYAEAQKQLDIALQRRAQTHSEQEIIRRYLPAYQALLSDKLIGEERRLDWIDVLGRIREQHKFFPMEYEIASRRSYQFIDAPSANSLKLSASRMRIKFPMLHEGDLFRLFDELRHRKVGLFNLDYCDITNNAQERGSSPQLARNLMAECGLDWLTTSSDAPAPSPAPSGR